MPVTATRDPRIDAYIARQAPFAQPLLARVREWVHEACPGVEEGIKWGMPAFMHRGRNLAGMGGFKAHCSIFLHQGPPGVPTGGMKAFGHIASLKDLPPKREALAMFRAVAALIDARPPAAPRRSAEKP